MRTLRLTPADRRRQIVDAARGVILDRGLAGTSLRDIAQAAGVSVGTVTYHFSGVDEILSAVVIGESERFYESVIRRADEQADPRAALVVLVEPLFADTPRVQEHWRIWSDYWTAVARRPEIAEAYAQRIRGWEECCTRTIARGVQEGIFTPVDPGELALQLSAYSDGIGMQRAQRVEGLTSERAVRWLLDFAGAALGCDLV